MAEMKKPISDMSIKKREGRPMKGYKANDSTIASRIKKFVNMTCGLLFHIQLSYISLFSDIIDLPALLPYDYFLKLYMNRPENMPLISLIAACCGEALKDP
jgi:hypothetical protein